MRHPARFSLLLLATLLLLPWLTSCLPAASPPACESSIETYFPRAGDDPAPVLIGLYRSAASRIDVAIYSFTHNGIAEGLASAAQRGVRVRLITSSDQAAGSDAQHALLSGLLKAGIPVRIDTHSGLMHLKMSIIDGALVASGSYNYSFSASNSNDEVLMVIRDPSVAKECLAEFDRMWTAEKGYRTWVP